MNSSEGGRASKLWLSFLAFGFFASQNIAGALPTEATGANVDESRVTKTLYVDPAHTEAADDDKHGAADQPFATLNYACQAAARAKDANVGVKIVLAPGTYREEATIPAPANGKPDTDAPLVIEAAEREQAVIDGADTAGWSPSTWKAQDGRWMHPWPFLTTPAAHPIGRPASVTSDTFRRRDLIVVNGTLLRQVNTEAELTPGNFWGMLPVASKKRTPSAGGGSAEPTIVVEPPPDTDWPGSIVQVGVRSHGLTIRGRRNVVVRGLLIQHAAEPGREGEGTAGFALERCANVLIEDVLCQWNDGTGLAIGDRRGDWKDSADFTLRRVRLLHNGGSGLTVCNVRNLLAEDNETSFNNFRGEWSGWTQSGSGMEVTGVRGSTWRRQHVIGNVGRGIWCNQQDENLTLEDGVVRDNFVNGLFLEGVSGPVLLRRCLITGTKNPPGPLDAAAFPAGLSISGTPDVTLESNVFAGNAVTQLGPTDRVGKMLLNDERHVYRHNVFYSADADAILYRLLAPNPGGVVKGGEVTSYYATLDSQENCFWNPVKAEVFEEYSYGHAGPKSGLSQPGPTLSASKLEDWQASVQKTFGPVDPKPPLKIEAGSIWQDPLFVDPAEGDYRLKQDSPVADWNLPSDDTGTPQ